MLNATVVNGDPKFLFYIFLSGQPYLGLGKLGTQLNLNTDTVGAITIGYPSLPEQKAIADFLDAKTAEIDALIAKKEELLKLLAEQRTALITHAVTKGLNPDAPTKDSGIDWLGPIPAHWEVMPLKRDITLLTSGSRGWANYYSDDGEMFIRIGNLTRNSTKLDLSDIQRVALPESSEGKRTSIKAGDILFSITAYLGSVAIIPKGTEQGYVSQHIALVRLRKKYLTAEFVGYLALSYVGKTNLEIQGYGGTKVQLSLDDIANLTMLAPPIEEQQFIAEYLDRTLCGLAEVEDKTQEAIDRLKEYRTALITNAFTGLC